MKIIKWISLTVAGLFAIIISGVIYVTAVLDPNDYIDNITQIVKTETDIDLGIGTVHWAFFPWLGISVDAISAAHPDAGQLANVKQAQFRLKVLPLLQKKIEVGSLSIIGAEVYIVAEKDGSLNFDVLTQGSNDEAKIPKVTQEDAAIETDPLPFDIAVAEVLVADALVHYTDKIANTRYELSNFTLKANHIQPLAPFPLAMSFNADAGDGITLQQRLQAQVTVDFDHQRYSLQQLQATTIIDAPRLLPSPLSIGIAGKLRADLEADTASVEGLTVQVKDTTLTGAAQITQLTGDLALQGQIQVDKVNLDDYLPAPNDDGEETPANTEQKTTDATASLIPIDVINSLNMQVNLGIGELIVKSIPVKNINLHVIAENGVVHVKGLSGDTLEGNFKLGAKLDVNGSQPTITVNHQLNSLQLAPLVTTFTDNEVFSGTVDFKGDINTKGHTVDDLIANLNGLNEFVMAEGLISGVNITQLAFDKLDALGPLVENLLSQENKAKAPPVFRKDTAISHLIALVELDNGIARTKQLSTELEEAKADGRAEVDLVKKTLAMDLNLKLSEAISNSYIAKLSWPIHCEGSLATTPNCSVKTNSVRRELEKLAKNTAKEKAQTALERKLDEKLGLDDSNNIDRPNIKEAADATLAAEKERLREKEEEMKLKVEDKLKDKLQGLFR